MFCSLFVYNVINVFCLFDTIVDAHIFVLLVFIPLHDSCSLCCWFFSHFILTMSNSKQPAKMDAIVCRNPFCSRGQKAFATKAALQKHLAVLPQCSTQFLLNEASSQWAQQPPRTSVNTSHKRKCVLCRDVVNNIDPAYLHTEYAPEPRHDVAFLPAGVIDADDDDGYDDNANRWEDYCLVVKEPTV